MDSFFSKSSQEILKEQYTFIDRTNSGQSIEYGHFKFASGVVGQSQAGQARLVLSPMEIEYSNMNGAKETINLIPGDVFLWFGAPCVSLYGEPQRYYEVLVIAHNGKISTKLLPFISMPHFGHWEIDWNRPVHLGPRQLMIRANALHAKGLNGTANENLNFLLEAYPNSKESLTILNAKEKAQCLELLNFGEKSLIDGKWSEVRGAFQKVIERTSDDVLQKKAQEGLEQINKEGIKLFDEAQKLHSDGKLREAKLKIIEAQNCLPDNKELSQYKHNLVNEINDNYIKSGLKAQWDTAQIKLAELRQANKANVAFQIRGEIKDQDINRTWIIVFGQAIPIDSTDNKVIGTLVNSAIQINSPNEKCIQTNAAGIFYMDGVHYLVGKTTVKNAFGAEVPAWVYGPPSAEIISNLAEIDKAQNEVEKLRAKIQEIGVEL